MHAEFYERVTVRTLLLQIIALKYNYTCCLPPSSRLFRLPDPARFR